MPAQESALHERPQTVVRFPVVGVDAYGEAQFGEPSELIVRWDNRKQRVLDDKGNTIALDGTVISHISIPVGDLLWLGTIEQILAAITPLTDVVQVKMENSVPDLKGRAYFHQSGFMRYKDIPATEFAVLGAEDGTTVLTAEDGTTILTE